jgi:hypothetical protein
MAPEVDDGVRLQQFAHRQGHDLGKRHGAVLLRRRLAGLSGQTPRFEVPRWIDDDQIVAVRYQRMEVGVGGFGFGKIVVNLHARERAGFTDKHSKEIP